MARIAGRRGRVYIGVTTGAVATPVTAQATWNINYSQSTIDVTAMGDDNRTYVADLPDAGGGFSGFYDDAATGTELYAAATDGLSRKFYLYPDLSSATKYYHGTVLIESMDSDGGVGNAVTANVTWKAASAVILKSS
jgi:hypothetical protein